MRRGTSVRHAGVVLAALLCAGCRSGEERAIERIEDNTELWLDSLSERTRSRPPPPDTGWNPTIPRRDTTPRP